MQASIDKYYSNEAVNYKLNKLKNIIEEIGECDRVLKNTTESAPGAEFFAYWNDYDYDYDYQTVDSTGNYLDIRKIKTLALLTRDNITLDIIKELKKQIEYYDGIIYNIIESEGDVVGEYSEENQHKYEEALANRTSYFTLEQDLK